MQDSREHKVFIKSRFARRGIYWLPNLLTTIALFAGFYAIVQAMIGRFELAAMAIFVAMVFDGLDGRVARLTRTQSAFGAEYESLADMESVAWLGPWLTTKLGWIAAFIYCACAALRLARFNTTLEVADKRFFQGLPSPAAACLIAGLVWALDEYHIRGQDVKWLAWGLTAFAGLTMVSNFKFYSGKDINLRKSVSFSVVVGITFGLMALFMLSSTWPQMLLLLFAGYAASGYVIWIYEQVRSRALGRAPPPPPGA